MPNLHLTSKGERYLNRLESKTLRLTNEEEYEVDILGPLRSSVHEDITESTLMEAFEEVEREVIEEERERPSKQGLLHNREPNWVADHRLILRRVFEEGYIEYV